jgi:Dolichyl-phosphate-mannose-protein mannosyltransferase
MRAVLRYPLFALTAASGVGFFLIKGLGLLKDVGGSKLNRHPTFALSIEPFPLAAAIALLGATLLLFRFRRSLTFWFIRATRNAREHPGRFAFRAAGALLLLHILLFAPFRYNELRLPDTEDPTLEVRYQSNREFRVDYRPQFEDYTRNYVISRSVRRLGVSRYFELDQAAELTTVERSLCRWALKNHPLGYHLLLAPLTIHPLLARGFSLLLYALVMVLAFLALRPLTGTAAAALGVLVFWGTPSNLFFIGMMTSNDLAVAIPILAGLALVTNARAVTPGRFLLIGLIFGIAFFTKYTAILGLGFAGLAAMVRFGLWRGIVGSLWIFAGFLPLAAAWILVLSGTPSGALQYDKYLVKFVAKATDPSRLGASSSTARGQISDFLAFLPAEWGPPAFLAAIAGILWLPFCLKKVKLAGAFPLLMFLAALAAAAVTIPKTNYIYFAQAGLFGFTALYLLKSRGPREGVMVGGVAVGYGVIRTVLFGLQTL